MSGPLGSDVWKGADRHLELSTKASTSPLCGRLCRQPLRPDLLCIEELRLRTEKDLISTATAEFGFGPRDSRTVEAVSVAISTGQALRAVVRRMSRRPVPDTQSQTYQGESWRSILAINAGARQRQGQTSKTIGPTQEHWASPDRRLGRTGLPSGAGGAGSSPAGGARNPWSQA
jgi:hypothetical protein